MFHKEFQAQVENHLSAVPRYNYIKQKLFSMIFLFGWDVQAKVCLHYKTPFYKRQKHITKWLLRSAISSGICTKLRTVAASNNRVHMPWSLYYCLCCSRHMLMLYVWCCSSRTSRSWWITQSTQRHRRGCNMTNIQLIFYFTHLQQAIGHELPCSNSYWSRHVYLGIKTLATSVKRQPTRSCKSTTIILTTNKKHLTTMAFTIQFKSCIFETQPKSNHDPKQFLHVKSKSKRSPKNWKI